MFYFNFYELQSNCEDQIPAIFVLTVGLSLEYNKFIFNNLIDFRYKCFPLNDIPSIIYRKKLLRRNSDNTLELLYRTKNPQSYCKNSSFLSLNCPINKKVQYLKLLSYRPISDTKNWIPTDYVENLDRLYNNELLNITNNQIHFKYEGTTNT